MGHWSESLVDYVAQRVGGHIDLQTVEDAVSRAGHEVEIMAGRSFHAPRLATETFEPKGMPFVALPDLIVGSHEAVDGIWPIPDPVDPQHATIMQVLPLSDPRPTTLTTADALNVAGQILAGAVRSGFLTSDRVLHWLGTHVDPVQLNGLLRRAMDPTVRISVPILGVPVEGWWFQVTRRLVWVTDATEDEGRLLQPLLDPALTDGQSLPLAASEPVLIVAPMTQQPAGWAFSARIWTEEVKRPVHQSWSRLAKAVHGHGIPTITVDAASTPQEVACQVVLKGYWHGYVEGQDPGLLDAVAKAYEKPVERVQRGIGAPDKRWAAAALLEQLIRPGFDPAQGAEATRRYVRRKANIVVMQHRKSEHPDRYPWTQIGISERRYYKLLPLFAQKVNGRYDVDHDEVTARMREYLDGVDRERAIREAALDVLHQRGFRKEAARKWLQRHRPEEAIHARPRNQRTGDDTVI
ncbi:hypothetical protein [Kribbella sp. NPDC051137]|uniref:hypothetical protein n=1 Tax=Kribbella sp. NPDC051137 TaxID=3155045 RepID=UPI003431C442